MTRGVPRHNFRSYSWFPRAVCFMLCWFHFACLIDFRFKELNHVMPSAKKRSKPVGGPTQPSAGTAAAGGGSKKTKPPPEPTIWDSRPGLFHALTAIPPAATLLYVITPDAFMVWLVVWNVLRTMLKSHGHAARTLGGHALTIYASYRSLDAKGWDETQHLAASVGTGLLMGVAFKNLMSAGLWLTSGFPERPMSSSSSGVVDGVDETRPAIVVPLQQANAGKGAPANVYGQKMFVVKVQLPLNKETDGKAPPGSFDGLGMVSDQRRTFQSFVDLETESASMAALTRLIATKGGEGGLRGYFEAHRQGDELRVYVDSILPEAGW